MSKSWAKAAEFLLPSGSFPKSNTPHRDEHVARLLIGLFYMCLSCLLLSQLIELLFSGKVEVVRTGYKVDVLEAPSLAICPFEANSSVIKPSVSTNSVEVLKYTTEGILSRSPIIRDCTFDRTCVCVDLSESKLHDFAGRETNVGITGQKSIADSGFQERIELTTRITDPSDDHVLKFGLYDTLDPVPAWVYAKEGSFIIGHLTLQKWTLSDLTISGVVKALRGDVAGLKQQRHLYRYTSEDVGQHSKSNTTSISYEMENFFVDETISSRSAFSPYSLFLFAALLVMRAAVVQVFIGSFFPKWKDPETGPEVRELSWQASMLSSACCCSCCFTMFGADDEVVGEPTARTPLV